MIWTDNMFVPHGRQRPDRVDVHELRLRPEDRGPDRGLRDYVPPVKGTREESREVGSGDRENTLIFPSDEMLSEAHQFDSGEALNNEDYIEQWQTVLGAWAGPRVAR